MSKRSKVILWIGVAIFIFMQRKHCYYLICVAHRPQVWAGLSWTGTISVLQNDAHAIYWVCRRDE